VAETDVSVLTLHRLDYDRFVRDILSIERRETFLFLKTQPVMENWSRENIEKIANVCFRKSYSDGEYIFEQGDCPEYFHFVFSGVVQLYKRVDIICKNFWPVKSEDYNTNTDPRFVSQPFIASISLLFTASHLVCLTVFCSTNAI
jgi:hypothetical protein